MKRTVLWRLMLTGWPCALQCSNYMSDWTNRSLNVLKALVSLSFCKACLTKNKRMISSWHCSPLTTPGNVNARLFQETLGEMWIPKTLTFWCSSPTWSCAQYTLQSQPLIQQKKNISNLRSSYLSEGQECRGEVILDESACIKFNDVLNFWRKMKRETLKTVYFVCVIHQHLAAVSNQYSAAVGFNWTLFYLYCR